MSKLKPIKDEAELARVPLEEPVLVELEPASTGADVSARSEEPEDDGPADDDAGGGDDIASQLRAAQQAQANAEREAREARAEAERLRSTTADNEKELLTGSLERAQHEEETAKAKYKEAYESGDPDAMADAQSKMARAAAQILNYEGAIANFGEGDKKPKGGDVHSAIDADPQLMSPEKEWLHRHPETLTDPKRNAELTVAHNRALDAGHARGTDAYFKAVDKFMGFDKPSGRSNERSPSVTAPVTRDAQSHSGRPLRPTQIVLSPEERQMAKNMGLSETVYARNKMQLEQRKQTDPERYATRR
jgi:hypothetical protein